MDNTNPANVGAYIAQFPPDVQERLQALRAAIREAAPDAAEKISYRMPTYHQHGNVVHFAAFKDHISLFPGSFGVTAFAHRLAAYKTSKGTIQFPYGKPLPLDLVKAIVRYRVDENCRIADARKKRRK